MTGPVRSPVRAACLLLAVAVGTGCAAAAGSGVGGVARAPAGAPQAEPEGPVDLRSGTGSSFELEVVGEADFGWAVRTLEGETVPLHRFRGRPLFLNVWATWCPPCVAELESIAALMGSLEGTDVAFLLVSPEDEATVAPFLARMDHPLPVAVEHTRIPESWGVDALPTTVVVDRRGRIVLRHRGAADWDQDPVRAFLQQLHQGEPP